MCVTNQISNYSEIRQEKKLNDMPTHSFAIFTLTEKEDVQLWQEATTAAPAFNLIVGSTISLPVEKN